MSRALNNVAFEISEPFQLEAHTIGATPFCWSCSVFLCRVPGCVRPPFVAPRGVSFLSLSAMKIFIVFTVTAICLMFGAHKSVATYSYGGSSSSTGGGPPETPQGGATTSGGTGGTTDDDQMSIDDTNMSGSDSTMSDAAGSMSDVTTSPSPLSLFTGPSSSVGVHYTLLEEFVLHYRAAAHSHFQEFVTELTGNAVLTPAHQVCHACSPDANAGVEMYPLDSATWDPVRKVWDDTVRVAASLLHGAFRHVVGRTGGAPWPLVSFTRRFAVANRLVRKYGGGYNPSLGHPPPAHFWEGGVPTNGPYIICAVPITCAEGLDFVSMIFQAHLLQEMANHVGLHNAQHAIRMGRVFNEVVWSRRSLASGGVILASFTWALLPEWVRNWHGSDESPIRAYFLTLILLRGGFGPSI